MGKKSRDKGARFERRCIKAIAAYTGWPHWERTSRSVTQPDGDLRPVNADGSASSEAEKYFVECKVRAVLSPGLVAKWFDVVMDHYPTHQLSEEPPSIRYIYLMAQDRGPLFVFDSANIIRREKVMGKRNVLHGVSIIL